MVFVENSTQEILFSTILAKLLQQDSVIKTNHLKHKKTTLEDCLRLVEQLIYMPHS